jgi:hypothetical protein
MGLFILEYMNEGPTPIEFQLGDKETKFND